MSFLRGRFYRYLEITWLVSLARGTIFLHDTSTVWINVGPGSAQNDECAGLDSHSSPLGWPKHDPINGGLKNQPAIF
jgi:hypothetical protein